MDGADGELLQLTGNLVFGIGGFITLSGGFGIRSASTTLAVAGEDSFVEMDVLTIGASNVTAFVGFNEGESDEIGLRLTDGNVALGIFSEQDGGRTWTALQATVGSVEVKGIPGLTLAVTDFGLEVNLEASDESVIDFADTNYPVVTSASTTETLDMNGDFGQLIQASGSLTLELFNFFTVSGDFAFVSRSDTVMVNGEEVEVDVITVGASNVNAFAGVNGVGFQLTNAGFALGIFNESEGSRSWIALKASVESAAFVGIDLFTVEVTDIQVEINQPASDNSLIDFESAPIDVLAGPDATVPFDMEDIVSIAMRATISIDVAGFVTLRGTFGFSITTIDGVDYLTATGKGITAALEIGPAYVRVVNANFGLRVGGDVLVFATSGGRFESGLGNLLTADVNEVVVEFTNATTSVEAGEQLDVLGVTYTFDEAISNNTITFKALGVDINIFNVITIEGNIGFKKTDQQVVVRTGLSQEVIDAETITFTGGEINIFVGVNGDDPDERFGFIAEGIAFGFSYVREIGGEESHLLWCAGSRTWVRSDLSDFQKATSKFKTS